jgi:rSAM/selenodomain-associated transferase 1
MVKEPRPGRVKTRLGRDIGMTASAWWFRHQVASLLRRIEDPRWDLVLAVSPDVEGLTSRIWPSHLRRLPQGQGDLGDRMSRVIHTFAPMPVCIIGADIPGVSKTAIARGFKSLGSHDAVFGPAPDGGYWLVGSRKSRPGMFANVRWSTQHALSDTARSFENLRIAYIDILRDIDTVEDLQK